MRASKRKRQTLRLALAAGIFAVLFCAFSNAQGYPAKTVRVVVPVATGGATDILTRALAQRLANTWGQQVLVDNRPGGGSNVGFEVAAKSPADGYTLLMAQPAFTVNVSLYKKLGYDPLRDFAAITLAATGANVLVVHPSVPAYTLKDFIALAKARPGQLNYASSGNGTTPHLSGELFNAMAGVKIVHIPYKGAGASVVDLLGGHVDLAFVSLSSVAPQLQAKKLRALAITSAKRSALMPELPTLSEAGLPGFDANNWYGIVVPARTPRAIINQLNAEVTKILNMPDVRMALFNQGLDPAPGTPEQFGAYIRSERIKWAKVIKAANIRIE